MRVTFNKRVEHHNLYNVYTAFHLLVYLLESFCFPISHSPFALLILLDLEFNTNRTHSMYSLHVIPQRSFQYASMLSCDLGHMCLLFYC